MAITVRCPVCKAGYAVGTKSCAKCGNNLQKNRVYKVVLKVAGKYRTKVTDDLEKAKQVEAKYRSDAIDLEELGIVEAPPIEAVWKLFHTYLTHHTKSATYYEKFWRIHIAPEFSGRKLSDIRPTDLDAFVLKLKERVRLPKPKAKGEEKEQLALSTVSNILKTIRRLFSFASEKGLYVGDNHAKRVSLPRYDNRMTNYLGDDELLRLLEVLRSWPNRMSALAFMLCLVTGKRTGEVFGLAWEDVDKKAGTMRFRIKSRVKDEVQVLPMSNLARSVLEEAEALRLPDCSLIFHTEQGKGIHYYPIWCRIRKKAGIREEIRPHDLRHTFASRLASSGAVDIYTLQNLLGHKTIAMTKRYSHLLDEALKRAVCVADEQFR